MEQSISLIFDEKEKGHIPFSSGTIQFKEGIILAVDIGGTKTNLSLFELKDAKLSTLLEKTFTTRDFPSFQSLLNSLNKEEIEFIVNQVKTTIK